MNQQNFRPLRQTTSWGKQKNVSNVSLIHNDRSMSCDTESHAHIVDEHIDIDGENWSSDCSNSDHEDHHNNSGVPVSFFFIFLFLTTCLITALLTSKFFHLTLFALQLRHYFAVS